MWCGSEVEVIIGVKVDVHSSLGPVEFHNLLVISRLLHCFVVSMADEAREAQGNALVRLNLTLRSEVHGT